MGMLALSITSFPVFACKSWVSTYGNCFSLFADEPRGNNSSGSRSPCSGELTLLSTIALVLLMEEPMDCTGGSQGHRIESHWLMAYFVYCLKSSQEGSHLLLPISLEFLFVGLCTFRVCKISQQSSPLLVTNVFFELVTNMGCSYSKYFASIIRVSATLYNSGKVGENRLCISATARNKQGNIR